MSTDEVSRGGFIVGADSFNCESTGGFDGVQKGDSCAATVASTG